KVAGGLQFRGEGNIRQIACVAMLRVDFRSAIGTTRPDEGVGLFAGQRGKCRPPASGAQDGNANRRGDGTHGNVSWSWRRGGCTDRNRSLAAVVAAVAVPFPGCVARTGPGSSLRPGAGQAGTCG